ncbi:hypothetical protein MMC26_006069 [Xylographa opegraphella]|nr:hypothetical protein [Xylographa opegraphella]
MNKLPGSASAGQLTSDSDILLRNLRLLDLDDDFDWPGISKDTFIASDTIKNQKQRIQRAEWVLYKLLERWNPSESEEKLRPYFPALEPLQSLNLRAALFRALNELKKTGVFRKSIFIRKSMLDDCKGPRFEEVLAALSTSVIYKILAEDDSDTSIVRRLLLGQQNLASIDVSILSMSYRASLTKRLSEKEELGQQFRKFGRMLDLEDHEIKQRGGLNAVASRGWTEKSVPQRMITKLTKHLSENSQGNHDWIEILVRSDRFRPQNCFLEQSFDKIWPHVSNDTLYKVRLVKKENLLENLESRVLIQNDRLEKWKQIKESLGKGAEYASQSTPTHMDKEKQGVDRCRQQSPRKSWVLPSRHKQHTAMDEVGMGETINETTVQDEKPRLKDIQRKSSLHIDKTVPTGSFNIAADHKLQPPSEEIAGIETPPLTTDDDSLDTHSGKFCMRPKSTNIVGSFAHSGDIFFLQKTDSQAESKGPIALQPLTPMTHTQVLTAQTPLSLAERTRTSMALASPVKMPPCEETQPVIATISQQDDDTIFSADILSTGGLHRSASLLDRTRYSMSLMSTTSHVRRQSLKPHVSKVYPVNQFNSPGREQSSTEPTEVSILEEILPDADADYETVFKSRPKIALSPRLSPVQDGIPYSAAGTERYGIEPG